MKRSRLFSVLSIIALLFSSIGSFIHPITVSAAYTSNRLIDNAIFLNSTAMTVDSIQSFLASKGSGLTTMSFSFDCTSTGMSASYYQAAGAPCGQTVLASTIIYYAAQIYGINPQVILATMQKEQSLVTSPNPTTWQVNQAMGYGCPDSGGCSTSNFLYQIDNGVWLLRYNMERARGNMDYWFHSTSWVCGTAKNYYSPSLYPGQNVSFYDDSGVLYNTVLVDNAATSSLYCYTPHTYNNPNGLYGLPTSGTTGQYYSGSYYFVTYFERWFGLTKAGECSIVNQPAAGTSSGLHIVGMRSNSTATLGLTIANNTGSGCAEVHQWTANYQGWLSHTATPLPSFDPSTGKIFALDSGTGTNNYVFVKYKGTANDMVEFHVWNGTTQQWTLHTVTQLPVSDLANGEIISRGNTLVFVKTKNTTYGKIEMHEWTTDFQHWASHIVSVQPASEATNGFIISRSDKLVFVKDANTPSGNIEFHEFAPGYQDWSAHIVSSQPNSEMSNGIIVSVGDHLAYVKYKGTPSGLMEVHEWTSNFSNWASHIVSNQAITETPY